MSRKAIPSLSDDEIEILRRGKTDPDIISDYFFRKPGAAHGWRFDYNFDPEGAWQKTLHRASQKRIIIVGGFGSGKTRGVGISACVWAMTTPDFAFLNAAPQGWQSELMYRFIIDSARGTPFERLIYESPKRPYPKIELRFWVGNILIQSTLEFMSVDKNASAILSWEGDWVNIDEAGQIDDLEGTIRNLGTRLRGATNERSRLGRLSMTTNSWDNPELWMRFDMASQLPADYLSITVSTRHNRNVTPEQLRLMLKDIPEDEHERFIDGTRPEGRGHYFAKQKVFACEDEFYGQFIEDQIRRNIPGYGIQVAHGSGVVYFKTPAVRTSPALGTEGHTYLLLGDPGTGDAPMRNSPALMVWDITDFPKYKANLAAFWWGSGGGSITPFINQLLLFMAEYDPIFTGVDNTGPQKATAELLNTYLTGQRLDPSKKEEWLGVVDLSRVTHLNVGGLDFSGGKKPAYLIAGRLMIEAGLFNWPRWVIGLRSQLTNYDPAKDRVNEPKIPQDLVATLCMSAHVIRVWFHVAPEELVEMRPAQRVELGDLRAYREARLSESTRTLALPRDAL